MLDIKRYESNNRFKLRCTLIPSTFNEEMIAVARMAPDIRLVLTELNAALQTADFSPARMASGRVTPGSLCITPWRFQIVGGVWAHLTLIRSDDIISASFELGVTDRHYGKASHQGENPPTDLVTMTDLRSGLDGMGLGLLGLPYAFLKPVNGLMATVLSGSAEVFTNAKIMVERPELHLAVLDPLDDAELDLSEPIRDHLTVIAA